MLITLCNSQLVVCCSQIKTTKVLSTTQFVQQVSYTRDGEQVKLGVSVQSAEINSHTQLTSLFTHKQDWVSIRRHTWPDPTLV